MDSEAVNEFIDDILTMGGPEKEFTFRGKFYFLETMYRPEKKLKELYIAEYESIDDKAPLIRIHSFWGKSFEECTRQFEVAKIFDGLTIYEAAPEIEWLYG